MIPIEMQGVSEELHRELLVKEARKIGCQMLGHPSIGPVDREGVYTCPICRMNVIRTPGKRGA